MPRTARARLGRARAATSVTSASCKTMKSMVSRVVGRVVLLSLYAGGVRMDVPYAVPVRGIAAGLSLVIGASIALFLSPKSGSGLASLAPPVKAN